jgi:hypothetical protein
MINKSVRNCISGRCSPRQAFMARAICGVLCDPPTQDGVESGIPEDVAATTVAWGLRRMSRAPACDGFPQPRHSAALYRLPGSLAIREGNERRQRNTFGQPTGRAWEGPGPVAGRWPVAPRRAGHDRARGSDEQGRGVGVVVLRSAARPIVNDRTMTRKKRSSDERDFKRPTCRCVRGPRRGHRNTGGIDHNACDFAPTSRIFERNTELPPLHRPRSGTAGERVG